MGAPKGTGKYGPPLQVPIEPEYGRRIARLAKREKVSQASIVRDIIKNGGLDARENRSN